MRWSYSHCYFIFLSSIVDPNRNTKVYAPVNLDRIQHWIDQGRLTSSPENPITARELLLSGCVHDVHDGIKLLASVCSHPYVVMDIVDCHTGLRVLEDCHSYHAVKSVEDCHPRCREARRHSFLQILQPSCSPRLCQGPDRPSAGCTCQAERHRYA